MNSKIELSITCSISQRGREKFLAEKLAQAALFQTYGIILAFHLPTPEISPLLYRSKAEQHYTMTLPSSYTPAQPQQWDIKNVCATQATMREPQL